MEPGTEVGQEEEKEKNDNLKKICEPKSLSVMAVPSNVMLEELSVEMAASMENGKVATSVQKGGEKKKVLSKKMKAHSPKETPVKVNSSSSRARRRKCEEEFGKVDDNRGNAPEVPIESVENAPGYNDAVAETVVEDENEVEEVKVKKVKKIIRMGRGPTKAKKRKEEKAEVKESLKSSEIVKPSELRRSSRSQQVSPVDHQDQESVEIRRRSKRGSNILPEQVPPSHSIGKCLSKSERAGVDDQKEVMQEEKKGEKGKSIEDPLCYEANEDERVHENSKVEKRLQRKNNISIEDTP